MLENENNVQQTTELLTENKNRKNRRKKLMKQKIS